MKKLLDKVTNSMDVLCGLDGSALWKFDRRTNTTTGAGGKVGERVSSGQGETFPLLLNSSKLDMLIGNTLTISRTVSNIFGVNPCDTCCRKKIKNQRPKSRTSWVST